MQCCDKSSRECSLLSNSRCENNHCNFSEPNGTHTNTMWVKQCTDCLCRSHKKVTLVLQLIDVHPSGNNDVQGSQWSERNLLLLTILQVHSLEN